MPVPQIAAAGCRRGGQRRRWPRHSVEVMSLSRIYGNEARAAQPASTRPSTPGDLPAHLGPVGAGPIAATIPLLPPMPRRSSIRTSPERWRPTSRAASAFAGKTWSRSPGWASSWLPAAMHRSEETSGLSRVATPTARCTMSCGIERDCGVGVVPLGPIDPLWATVPRRRAWREDMSG